MASPFLAWCLRSAKTSSCLRSRFAPSSSLALAISTSSETCLSFRSDKCIGLEDPVGTRGPLLRNGVRPGYGGKLRNRGVLRGRARTLATGYSLSDIAVNESGELCFREGADLGRLDVAVLEEHQRGDAPYPVLGRRALVLVDVELRDLEAPLVLGGDLVEGRRDHLAGAAPLGPVVHEDRGLGLEHFVLESVVGDVDDLVGHGEGRGVGRRERL